MTDAPRRLGPIRRILNRVYVNAPERIPIEQWRLLGLIGAAFFIANYDVNLYGLAIPQIQKSLGIAEEDVGRIIFIFRLGMIPALALAYLADRIGRRTLLMVTLAGASVATVWTAFAQSVPEFVAAQTLARMFIYTEELLCFVVIAEEFGPSTRGWALGRLGALGALGAGFGALVFGFVNVLPFGWRALYFLGAFPLLWLLWARRTLPETKRFAEQQSSAIGPLTSLMRNYPGRLALLVCMVAPYAFGVANCVVMFSKFLQSTHGWSPAQVTTTTILGGSIAIFGNMVAGSMSDRIGRRAMLLITVLGSAGALAAFYSVATGWWLVALWIAGFFMFMAADVLIASMGAELFPTSHRSVASGIRMLCSLFAGGIALLIEAELYGVFGAHGPAIAWMTVAAPLSLIAVAFLPEPAGKTLEEVSGERAP